MIKTWFSTLSTRERRTFWGCFGGWALDGMDVQLYTFAIPALMTAWNLSRTQAGELASVVLLLSALGGWLAGALSDRIGRVRTLQLSILWFAGFTFLSAFAQSFAQFAVCRSLMGLGFGAEWAAGAVLIGETIRPELRGRAVGTVQSAWAIGWAAANGLSLVCLTLLPPDLAWRAMFAAGLAPALLVIYLRRHVPEPEIFLRQPPAPQRLLAIFEPPVLRVTVLAALLSTGAQGGYYALTTWLPTFLKTERGLSVAGSSGFIAVVIAGAFAGYLVGAQLADRLGRRRLFFCFGAAAIAVAAGYTLLPLTDRALLVLGFPLGFCASGYFAGVGPFLTELYATRMRGAGQGFSYNFGRGIGALFPALVGALSTSLSLGAAIAVFTTCAYALMCLAALLLPETAGRDLRDTDALGI